LSQPVKKVYVEIQSSGGNDLKNKLLTVNEVAKILRVSNMTVYRLVKSNQLTAIRVGKNYRIKESEVEKYINRGERQ